MAAQRLEVEGATLADAARALAHAAGQVRLIVINDDEVASGLPGTDVAAEQLRLADQLTAGATELGSRVVRLGVQVATCSAGYAQADAALEQVAGRKGSP